MKYFNHITVDTWHARKSYRNEVADNVVETMRDWIAQMKDGKKINIYDNYYCELLHINSKMADFLVSIDNDGVDYDVLRFTVCLHSRYKSECWKRVDGEGNAPQAPFIAVKLINPEFADMALGDFERCIAWGLTAEKL